MGSVGINGQSWAAYTQSKAGNEKLVKTAGIAEAIEASALNVSSNGTRRDVTAIRQSGNQVTMQIAVGEERPSATKEYIADLIASQVGALGITQFNVSTVVSAPTSKATVTITYK